MDPNKSGVDNRGLQYNIQIENKLPINQLEAEDILEPENIKEEKNKVENQNSHILEIKTKRKLEENLAKNKIEKLLDKEEKKRTKQIKGNKKMKVLTQM